MLQPRGNSCSESVPKICLMICVFVWPISIVAVAAQGLENVIDVTPRWRRDSNDVTTVLLVDSHGRSSSFGRFPPAVKPDLGLITSTARTFIQDGVTTEYATQVLGTTLDNGRLYAQLLTKSSRVLYDGNPNPSKIVNNHNHQLYKNGVINTKQLVSRNTEYLIRPNHIVEPAVVVFPTVTPAAAEPTEALEDEILKGETSNNPRVAYDNYVNIKNENVLLQDNVKTFKISPQMRDLSYENIINHKEETKPDNNLDKLLVSPSKIRPWDNLPTFTVRNEFAPSGFSYLGNLPDLDVNTERSKATTLQERRAKLLFRAGLVKPEPKSFQTITYTGFADFTTTVGDTVIVFSPHTTQPVKNAVSPTKITIKPTIRPTTTLEPSLTVIGTKIKTFLSHKSGMETQTVEGHKLDMKTILPTMIIDKTDRMRNSKEENDQDDATEHEDIDAKLAVLAHEQQQMGDSSKTPLVLKPSTTSSLAVDTTTTATLRETTSVVEPDVIAPSVSQEAPMLSIPSPEDIAKILASLQAQQATEPLQTKTTKIVLEGSTSSTSDKPTEISSGSTTIFFEDDPFVESTNVLDAPTTLNTQQQESSVETDEQTTEPASSETTQKNDITTTPKEQTTLPVVKEEALTTLSNEETTQKEPTTTTNSVEFGNTQPDQETTPGVISNEVDTEVQCTDGSKILPTTAYKTLTYLTTFFIPQDDDTTTTSVKANKVVSTEIGYHTEACDLIRPSSTQDYDSIKNTATSSTTELEKTTTTTTQESSTTEIGDEESTTTTVSETTPQEITTEIRHVTESEPTTTEVTTESDEEIELIFKTLYTTYTYLTTYFQDTTSSIASKIVVTTNVITSTLLPGHDTTDSAIIAGLFDTTTNAADKSKTISFEDFADISPTRLVQSEGPSPSLIDDDDEQSVRPTPRLNDAKVLQTANGVKTYYTTYTYFTTIFVDGETEISSRTEVYTNYVTPSAQDSFDDILPTRIAPILKTPSVGDLIQNSDDDETLDNIESSQKQKVLSLNIEPSNKYDSVITRRKSSQQSDNQDRSQESVRPTVVSSDNEQSYVTLQRGAASVITTPILSQEPQIDNNLLNEYETIATMITDVRSSTSEGDRRLIENVDKRNVLLDDQIGSESNNESEIIPSPTLLLQTSYTTFTYFTTMYQGTTSSNVVSRLETITNVVTETLTPTHTLSVEDLNLPITYYTTFTYWTTLYRDGITKVTSREETVSNVVTPSLTLPSTISITPTDSPDSSATPTTTQLESESIQPSSVGDDDLTTYFTTYTYFTTSYIGNSTVLNSRLETVTNVLNDTADIASNNIGRAVGTASQNPNSIDAANIKTPSPSSIKPTGLLSTIVSTVENSGTTTVLSTDVFGTYIDGLYAKVLESSSSILPVATIKPSQVSSQQIVKPTGVVSINQGKIIDADGISTLYYTTQAVGTYVDNLYAQVIESTSSLKVNEERRAALATDVPINHRTGLVRLIEGSIVQNHTTTLYQSKVLGTVIDGRYAQIIESTSSFLVDKVSSSSIKPSASIQSEIVPTSTKASDQQISPTATPITPSPVAIESSISDSSKIDAEESSTEETDEENESDRDDVGNSRVKSRIQFQSKKRTFTPAIRPFASRARPTFSIRKRGPGPATTVTRSDVTPTVTAVPASKPGRFGNRRNSSSNNAISPTASGSKRFSRPKSSSSSSGGASSSYGNARRSSSRIQPTATGFGGGGSSSRRNLNRSSLGAGGGSANLRASSLFAGNSRFRIRPTLASSLTSQSPSSAATTPASENDDSNSLTTQVTDGPPTDTIDNDTTLPLSTTTEAGSRRGQNPLLKFRRPPLSRPPPGQRNTTPRSAASKTTRPRATTTTTTPKPRTTNSRLNPVLSSRQRPNSLFPRRGLFTTTTTPATTEEEQADQDDLEEEEQPEGEEGEDVDYEGSQTKTQTVRAPAAAEPTVETKSRRPPFSNTVQIRPFQRRFKRETPYSRFRRPLRTTEATTTTTTTTPQPETVNFSNRNAKKSGRFRTRTSSKTTEATTPAPATRKRITPTKASSQNRSQFTLREKASNSRSSYKRPTSNPSRPRGTNLESTRPKAPRLTTRYHQTEAPVNNRKPTSNRGQSASRGTRRGTTRARQENYNVDDNFVVPKFDGTITVTHQIPTEVTIPVVNNGITEYKNVITAKYSTNILGPKQYSTSQNALGKDVTVLASEATSIGDNGATFITQFILNETPTSSIAFTPTYIRGRKTSFSHVIPSTAYGVEQVVNTIQPALAAQAPLANILLSQLLLGGLQPQNPLLALQNQGLGGGGVPTTQTKTRATTYVTTVTSSTSTVIPLTFRGKEILTTIVDSTVTVLTATEFLTDTVVVTPTFGNQLNTLLLPLLQQQLAQQQSAGLVQPTVPSPANVFNIATDNQPLAQALYKEPERFNLAVEDDLFSDSQEFVGDDAEQPEIAKRKSARRKNKKVAAPTPAQPPKETSVITLYVSGKTPGEFSTVLSTFVVGENDRRRREVRPSVKFDDLVVSTLGYYDSYIMPATKEPGLNSKETQETESLESVVGDVTKYVVDQTTPRTVDGTKPTKYSGVPSKKYKIKYVRASEEINKSSEDNNQRRVRKKLIRRQPVTAGNSTKASSGGKIRRRLKIKKKKRLILDSVSTEEVNLPLSTPRRRTVVITRKKLLRSTISASETSQNSVQSTKLTPTDEDVTAENIVETSSADVSTEQYRDYDYTTTEFDDEPNVPTILPESDEAEQHEDSTESDSEEIQDNQEETVEPESTDSDSVPRDTKKNQTADKIDGDSYHVPDYEPFFPELSDSLDASILLLKTTVLSSIELITKTVLQSRLRTYTILVTRVNKDEQITTSTTEVRPQTKTVVLTETQTKFTTLTLLDFDPTSTSSFDHTKPMTTPLPALPQLNRAEDQEQQQQGRGFVEEARYNLATRVMSNGVEVIIAGDKSTLPGEPMNVKRVLTNSYRQPVTLKPSTLSDHMMLMLPQEASKIKSITALSNQLVTKTCLTTFTYLTTFLESGTTTVSSHEQVVSNVATEERNTGKILPTPMMGITLTQYPNLSVGLFHTTYTYLNTILDGEQPLVVTSAHTVTNTVTAPNDYLSLLQPSIDQSSTALKDTNTYYKTISLEKTLYEGDTSKIMSTNEVVTQVVITESVPPKATSVMTSYIALDADSGVSLGKFSSVNYTTTDVVKTYFVTYTYYHTLVSDGQKVLQTNVSTSSDVVTEKLFVQPKKTVMLVDSTSPENKYYIVATKTLQTTFTYFTTLLQENNVTSPTTVSSRTKVVENVVTETIESDNINQINVEINERSDQILPTQVLLPIEKTQLPNEHTSSVELDTSTPSVIIGSTIIFIDDEVSSTSQKTTPSLAKSTSNNKKTKTSGGSTSKTRRSTINSASLSPTKVSNKKPALKTKPNNQVTDLLGLGSINIDSIQALTPVLNAMAGLIKTNLKSNKHSNGTGTLRTPQSKKSDLNATTTQQQDVQNRSPIYIPVRGLEDDFEMAESQNIATFHLQETTDWNAEKKSMFVKPVHESSLLNGGIPISPGEIITTNSDVIVGRPGRIGPRIPSIPLNQVNNNDYGGLKPPPPVVVAGPAKKLSKNHGGNFEKISSAPPRIDDYVGDPPPAPKRDKHKHIPLRHPLEQIYGYSPQNDHQQQSPLIRPHKQDSNNFGFSYDSTNNVNMRKEFDQNSVYTNKYQNDPNLNNPMSRYNLQPSIVFPEVVERSTGQPLLVNIQPSQVAFVSIPHNRSTALIYGGSVEPHRNGQYFDDPSPYPEPEFSAIESFNNGIPQLASVYHDSPVINQKEVGGVIKVGTQPITASSSENSQRVVQFRINPSKPIMHKHNNKHVNHHEISLNVPPISFGMIQQDNDFNAHIIDHSSHSYVNKPFAIAGNNKKHPPSVAGIDGFVNTDNYNQPLPTYTQQHGSEEIIDLRPPTDQSEYQIVNLLQPPFEQNFNQYLEFGYNTDSSKDKPQNELPPPNYRPFENKFSDFRRPRPGKPNLKIVEFMTPPPLISNFPPNQPQFNHNKQHGSVTEKPYADYVPQDHRQTVSNEDQAISQDDSDLTNEDGELIQESNSRPLRPGEVPIEILKITTEQSPSTTKNIYDTYKFSQALPPSPNQNLNFNGKRPDFAQSFPDTYEIPQDPPRPALQKPTISNQFSEIIPPNPVQHQNKRVIPQGFQGAHEHPPGSTKPAQNFNINQKPMISKPRPFSNVSSQQENRVPGGHSTRIQFITSTTQTPKVQKPQNSNNLRKPLQPRPGAVPDGFKKHYTRPRNSTRTPVSGVFTTKHQQFFLTTTPHSSEVQTNSPPFEGFVQGGNQWLPHPNTDRPIQTIPIVHDVYESKPRLNGSIYNNAPQKTHHKVTTVVQTKKNSEGRPSLTELLDREKIHHITSSSPSSVQNKVSPQISITTEAVSSDTENIMVVPPRIETTDRFMVSDNKKPESPKIDTNLLPFDHVHPEIIPPMTLEGSIASPTFVVPDLITEMVPPPPKRSNSDENVLGMSPPPLLETMLISPTTKVQSPPAWTIRSRTRTRKPLTRTKIYRRPVITASPSVMLKPAHDGDFETATPTRTIIVDRTSIVPSPTTKNVPSMEVIIGNPIQLSPSSSTNLETDHHQSGSIHEDIVESLSSFKSSPDQAASFGSTASYDILRTSTKTDVLNTAVHHTGNEVKISDDDFVTVSPSTQKALIPTRYITYTKTSTVTITKTTIVKTSGGPPSTLTLLVTKTEKSTIIDTVTEVHTLVQPTSIVETITTTVNPTTVLPTYNSYDVSLNSVSVSLDTVSGATATHATVGTTEKEPLNDVDVSGADLQNITEDSVTLRTGSSAATSTTTTIATTVQKNEPIVVQNHDNESIFVIMTDENKGNIVKMPSDTSYETQERDEIIINNEANNVRLGSIFISNLPSLEEVPKVKENKCAPECKASRNELCQKIEGIMRCVCRLGFARMFPDRPCIPTYTYDLKIHLERYGREKLQFSEPLKNVNSTEFAKLTVLIHEALDRMVMQSDLRDVYHGVKIHSYEPVANEKSGLATNFYLQLSDNTDDNRLKDVFKKYLRNNNFSLGGTELYAARDGLNDFGARDFDECTDSKFHDCSEHAQCFNLKGTYTCSCKEGYADLSENSLYPGRICSAEIVGCEKCNYHGTCYSRGDNQVLCECFHWYAGDSCHVNLKVLLIALVTLGAILLILLFVCLLMACCRKKPINNQSGMSFFPQRNRNNLGTMERRVMIQHQDTSSEDSRSETNIAPAVAYNVENNNSNSNNNQNGGNRKGALKKTSSVQQPSGKHVELTGGDQQALRLAAHEHQKDRSLTVMIPRAKYHPIPPTSPLINYTTFDARKPSVPSTAQHQTSEDKLLSYLDAGPSPGKFDNNKRKHSNDQSHSFSVEKQNSLSKNTGALVSAGFEVSATVLPGGSTGQQNLMMSGGGGTLGTNYSTEADRSENATLLIQKITNADVLLASSTRTGGSRYNSLRKSLLNDDINHIEDWLDITPIINTVVSEARSFDETTIPPPTKSLGRNDFDSKLSSQHQNDEANTMAERDLGSTFLLPHTHLYKPDRGSDISGFESL